MPDEYEEINEVTYSAFWPLIILLAGLILWIGYQVFETNAQRGALNQEFENAGPAIKAAQNVQGKYIALIKDLVQTSSKDPYAAQVVKEATAAGLLHQTAGTNSAPAPGDPSK